MFNKKIYKEDIVMICAAVLFCMSIIFAIFILCQHVFGIKEGVIYEKIYDDSDTSFVYSGKVAIPQCQDEEWRLYFEDDNGNKNWVDVDEKTYRKYDIGDYWDGE